MTYMKYFFFLVLFITNLSHSDENNQLLLHKEPKKISEIRLNSLDYKDFQLLSLKKNDIFIVNFWATWCAPCIKEIPDLIALKDKFGDKIEIFFISVDSNPTKAIPKFIKKYKINFENFFTDKKMIITKENNIKIMPTTLLINNQFEEVSRVVGYIDWKSEEVLATIQELL